MSEFTPDSFLIWALMIGAIVFPVWLGLRLRRVKPDVLWIGVLLSLLFGPLGQVYVAGWLPWALILAGVCFGAQQFLRPDIAMLVMIVSSPLVIFFRMRR